MPLTREERKTLLKTARRAIKNNLGLASEADPPEPTPALRENRGAFVTLHRGEALRGCIGAITTEKPLVETIAEMAVSASSRDPRFPPVTSDELGSLEIEVSVLSNFREIQGPEEVEVGRHGLLVAMGNHSGLLLPQVATEYGFTPEVFLDETCFKAGLEPGAWRKGAKVYSFEAEVFGEKDFQ